MILFIFVLRTCLLTFLLTLSKCFCLSFWLRTASLTDTYSNSRPSASSVPPWQTATRYTATSFHSCVDSRCFYCEFFVDMQVSWPERNRVNAWENGDIPPHILSPGTKLMIALRSSCSNPTKIPWYSLYRRLVSAPEPVWTHSREENSLASFSGKHTAVSPLCSQYTGQSLYWLWLRLCHWHPWFLKWET